MLSAIYLTMLLCAAAWVLDFTINKVMEKL